MERRRLVTIALLLGCALAETTAAAEQTTDEAILLLKDALDRLFGQRDGYDLYLYPPSPGDPPGYFPLLELSVDDANIDGLSLAHVSLTLRSVELDLDALSSGKVRFRRGRVQNLEVALTEKDVRTALERQPFAQRVRNLKVRLSRGTVHVSGRLPVGPLAPEASLSGGFEVVDEGRRVLFVPESMDVGGCSTGKATLDKLDDQVNPVLDLDTLARRYNIDLRIKWIRARSGELRIAG